MKSWTKCKISRWKKKGNWERKNPLKFHKIYFIKHKMIQKLQSELVKSPSICSMTASHWAHEKNVYCVQLRVHFQQCLKSKLFFNSRCDTVNARGLSFLQNLITAGGYKTINNNIIFLLKWSLLSFRSLLHSTSFPLPLLVFWCWLWYKMSGHVLWWN